MADPIPNPQRDDPMPQAVAPTPRAERRPALSEAARAALAAAERDAGDVAHRIEEIPADDAADVMEGLSAEQAADVAEYLDPDTAGAILSEMDPERAAEVLAEMEAAEASMIVSAMDRDDAVDVLEYVPDAEHDAILSEMEPEEAEEVRQLEEYDPYSAGGIMTPEYTALAEDLTVQQAVEELRRLQEEMGQIFYVYVVDRRGHLVGVLSMRDLILAQPSTKLSRVMRPNVSAVPATMDQEEVARTMRRNGYLAMPVVDLQHRLIGIITFDDAAEVMEEEATEDVQKMFGAGAEERLNSPWSFSFKKRVWWLQVNLLTAFMAAAVVASFDQTIQKLAILAAYMPVIAGMGGNASAQAMAVAIRGIATGRVDRKLMRHVLLREVRVGFLTGVVTGLTTAAIAVVWRSGAQTWPQSVALGAVAAVALMVNQTLACLTGAGVPFVMKRLGFDPAQSATIFATTITDVGGFLSLLGLAYLCMGWLTN